MRTDLIKCEHNTPATSSDTPGLDDLRRLARRLDGLLADPHPGLFTWREALGDTLLDMADYAGYGMISEAAKRAYR